jgi:hypothetical protein
MFIFGARESRVCRAVRLPIGRPCDHWVIADVASKSAEASALELDRGWFSRLGSEGALVEVYVCGTQVVEGEDGRQ